MSGRTGNLHVRPHVWLELSEGWREGREVQGSVLWGVRVGQRLPGPGCAVFGHTAEVVGGFPSS